MGQKVNPNGFRYGITKDRVANWNGNKKQFVANVIEDSKIRDFIEGFVRQYQIGKVDIIRDAENNVNLKLHSAKPGVILGEGGKTVKELIVKVQKAVKNKNLKLTIDVVAIDKPELNARLVAEDIATQLENRGSFRRAQKMVIRNSLRAGAVGIKTQVSGRLNGADMARAEGYTEGEMKLHTLRQNVDYAKATARTTYGAIGIKVWISLGEILEGDKNASTKKN